jgi:hypothetical protein
MQKLVVLCAVVVSLAAPGRALADKVFRSGKGATWDCKQDPVVKIDQAAGSYTFKGACKVVHVNGSLNKITIESSEAVNLTGAQNTVTIGAVDALELVGASNTVTYRSGVSRDAPKVSDVGAANRVSREKSDAAPPPAAAAPPASASGAHDCAKQPEVIINDGDGNLRFVGKCTSILINGGDVTANVESVQAITINGSDNTLTLGTVDKITVNGADNKISYRKSSTGGRPKLSSLGDNNKVTQLK